MATLAVIRAQVESRLPGALTVYERAATEVFPTGVADLDRQIGGIPQSALTQICAAPVISSGKTSLLISAMAQITRRQQFCALVDAGDSFDPASAEPAGVNLARLLWVRCGSGKAIRRKLSPLEQAFKAADILVQNGGFALIAVDLGNVEEKLVRKVPLTTWFRFARVIEKMPAALVFLMPYPAAQSCAGLTLQLSGAEPRWSEGKRCRDAALPRLTVTDKNETDISSPDKIQISHAQFLVDLRCEVEIGRSRLRKPAQSAHDARFTAIPRWA